MVRRRVEAGGSPHRGGTAGEARRSQLLAITGSIQDAVVSVDADQRISFWNAAAERMFGWPESEALGEPLTIIVPERLHEAHLSGIARVVRGEVPHLIGGPPVELVARRRDGSEIPVELALGRYYEHQRQLFTAVLRDISERTRIRRYEATQERVAAALLTDGADDVVAERTLAALGAGLGWTLGAIWLSDADLLACCATWTAEGVDAGAFVRRSRELRLHEGEGLPGHVAARRAPVWVDDVAASPLLMRGAEARQAGMRAAIGVPLLAGDELVGTLEFFLPAPHGPDQELSGLVEALSRQLGWVFLRKRAERELAAQAAELELRADELQRSNEDLERFAYVASHDLSEPLRTIAGFVQLLRDRHADSLDPQGVEFLDFAQQGAVRMRAIIDDLLSYARAGRAELHMEQLDLGALIREVAGALGRQIEEEGASVELGELPTVLGDPRQLSQLFQNLISNAVKFHGEDAPRVAVSAEETGGMWAIHVEDNGIGIDPGQAERVFEMFVRLHRREDYDGTGIGLALCRRIAERHGGGISAVPGASGGTRITVSLPTI